MFKEFRTEEPYVEAQITKFFTLQRKRKVFQLK